MQQSTSLSRSQIFINLDHDLYLQEPTVATASSNLRIPLAAALRDLGSKCVVPEGQELQSLQELSMIVSDIQFTHKTDSVAFNVADATYKRLESLYFDFLKARDDSTAADHKIKEVLDGPIGSIFEFIFAATCAAHAR